MNKIILCEGETDAILLSYYLDKVAGWKFCKKGPADIAIKTDTFEQSANWYQKNEDRLLICAVGGKDKVEAHASSVLKPVVTTMRNNEWISNAYKDAYEMDQMIDALLVVIPTEHQGALETLMMDSIAEDPYDAVIVKKAGEFVEEMKPVASKYIDGRRKEIKAHLGVTWAIQYPEKVFKLMNEQIQSVEWEKSEVLRECFEQLIEI